MGRATGTPKWEEYREELQPEELQMERAKPIEKRSDSIKKDRLQKLEGHLDLINWV